MMLLSKLQAAFLLIASSAAWGAGALPVPTTGVYLGFWANPNLAGGQEKAVEIREGPPPNGVNHTFALHLVYYQWGDIAAQLDSNGVFQPDAALAGDISHGRVPVISWKCDLNVPNSNSVIAGGDANEDALITASARALKQYPGPVMLRWFWEFNQLNKNQSCRGDTGGAPTAQVYNGFINAWRHIWTLFQNAGATNVVFVWNPGSYMPGASNDPHGYYPGNGYVDWIAVDTYWRDPTSTFTSDFDQFYNDFSQSQYAGKPTIVGENGAPNYSINNAETQASYLATVLAALTSNRYPLLKAYDYFDSGGIDSKGQLTNWVLDDNNGKGNGGLAEFAVLAANAVFAPRVGGPALNSGSAANGATYIAGGLVPGSWAQVKGSNLATTTHIGWSDADYTGLGNNLPTNLNGTTVQVNGIAAAVYAVSSGQVNFQVPAGVSGTASVQVFVNGTPSNVVTAATANNAPGIFPCAANGTYYPCGYFPDGKLVGDPAVAPIFRKAKPGDVIQMFGTGLAPSPAGVRVTQQPVSGVNVTIGTITVPADAAVLVYPGEFQVNFTVPQQFANMPAGNYPLTITVNGVQSPATINPDAPGPVVVPIQPPAASPTTFTFYVAPNGNDSWSGTLPAPNPANNDGPFATFDRARAAVQSLNKTGLSQVTVQFRAGTYLLPSTEDFTSADSGTPTLKILYQNYPGETPVISGGMRIQNWTNTGGNTWKATLPASTRYFENLFYNGVRRLRPRLGGYLGTYYRVASTVYLNAPGPPAAAPNPNCSVYMAGSGWECFDRFQYNTSDPIAGTWKNLVPAAGNPCSQPAGNPVLAGDIEVLDWEQFSTSKLRVSCIDTVNRIVYLTGPTAISQNSPQYGGFVTGNRYLVDNVQDALTQPGQWFLDHSTAPWTLTYLANPGENPNTDIVVAPQLPQVLVATGLQYVTFQGLTFEHDDYVVPSAGHKSSELEADIRAAVSFQNSQFITFDSGTVTQISGAGLEFISCVNGASPAYCVLNSANAATANDVIQNSAVYDTGALGIRIGDPYINADSDANVPQSMTVQNNVVEGYGRTIPASFGIGQGFGHDNLYTHNDVYDGYHCAISISESASDITKPNGIGNANNTISFNHVYDLLQGIMNDGGAIRIAAGNNAYTAPGNKILNNKIHDVSDASALDSNGYGGDGIYLDNQTGLVDVENNLVYRVSGNAVYTPQGPSLPNEANVIRNNILAYASQSMVAINYPYPYGVPPVIPEVFVVTGNLFYFDRSNTSSPKFFVQGGCLYAGGVAFPQFQQWSSNMYWRTDGSFASEAKAFAVQPNPGTGPNAPCSGNTSNWDFYTFAQWQQKVGEDTQSVVQNPGFANPAYPADDYSLPKGSPGVGQAGRSNPVINPPAVAPSFPTKPFNPATDF